MKPSAKLLLCALLGITLSATRAFAEPDNPRIDMEGFLKTAQEAADERRTHRVSEEDFLWMSKVPGTVILDARSAAEFRRMHIEGAINLGFAEIDAESLRQRFPDQNTRILIYCDNNFLDRLSRAPRAALNLSTYVALYTYGYHHVYELAALVDVHATCLKLVPPPEVSSAFPRGSSKLPPIMLSQTMGLTLQAAATPSPHVP